MSDITYETQPSYTYKLDTEDARIISTVQGQTAMQQAIFKILNTERYKTPIYSWNYGVELDTLIGKPISYCIAEIERRIKEALMQDDRISDVNSFEFSRTKKGVIKASFIVKTTEGNIGIEKEVNI